MASGGAFDVFVGLWQCHLQMGLGLTFPQQNMALHNSPTAWVVSTSIVCKSMLAGV